MLNTNNICFLTNVSDFIPMSESIDFNKDVNKALQRGEKVITFDVEVINLDGTPTRNNVIYPIDEMKKALSRERLQQMQKTGVFYGELEHPTNPEDLARWTSVDRTRVHFKFVKFWFDGTRLMGRVQTVPGNGDLMVNSIRAGELPSFSIRVIGKPDVDEKSGTITLHEIHLIAVDWVTYPGNPTSYVTTSDAFKLIDAPLKEGFKYSEIARGESNDILNDLGITKDMNIYNVGNGLFVSKTKSSLKPSSESVRMRNRIRSLSL